MKGKMFFLSNYQPEFVISERARRFASAVSDQFETQVLYRTQPRWQTLKYFISEIIKQRPDYMMIFDHSLVNMLAALFFRLVCGGAYIVDIANFAKVNLKERRKYTRESLLKYLLIILEKVTFAFSSAITCRGRFLKVIVMSHGYNNVFFLPEAVDTSEWKPIEDESLRKFYGLDGYLTIGMMGTVSWSEKVKWAYGVDVIETVKLLEDKKVKGVIVPVRSSHGDPKDILKLKELASRLDIADRIVFIENVARKDVPHILGLIDICLSTQTNTLIGEMRTTAKLPEYLACGRFILASRVGEASVCLPEIMLIDYDGYFDPDYSSKLAKRVRHILEEPSLLDMGNKMIKVAKERFEFDKVAMDARNIILQSFDKS